MGAASDLKHPLRGGAGGALGAVAGEMIAPTLPQDWNKDVRIGLAALTGAAAAFALGQDPIAASLTATNAAENNCVAHETHHPLTDTDRALYEAQMKSEKRVLREGTDYLLVEQEHLARPRRELIADALGLESHFFERSQSRNISWWERIAYQERAGDAFERTVEAHMLPTNRLGQFMDRATVVTLPFGVVREAQPLLQGTRVMALQSTRAGAHMAGSAVRATIPGLRGSAVSLMTTGQEVAQNLRFPSLRFANATAGEARVLGNEVAAFRGVVAPRPSAGSGEWGPIPLWSARALTYQGGRSTQGIAHASAPLVDSQVLLRGTQRNAGFVPQDIASQLAGKTFKTFDDFRSAFWKAVAQSRYAGEFGEMNLARMQDGFAPFAPRTQHLGGQKTYHLHHIVPINQGGPTYDLSNILIATPKFHKEVLERAVHFGGKL